jgi:hypothetical protein
MKKAIISSLGICTHTLEGGLIPKNLTYSPLSDLN